MPQAENEQNRGTIQSRSAGQKLGSGLRKLRAVLRVHRASGRAIPAVASPSQEIPTMTESPRRSIVSSPESHLQVSNYHASGNTHATAETRATADTHTTPSTHTTANIHTTTDTHTTGTIIDSLTANDLHATESRETDSERPEAFPRMTTAEQHAVPDEQSSAHEEPRGRPPNITVTGTGSELLEPRWPQPASPSARLYQLRQQDIATLYPVLNAYHDTRLVEIAPEDGSGSPISCQSSAVALRDNLSYVALSHFWGRNEQPQDIFLNGRVFKVRRALYEALEVLRQRKVGKVWIDNLCINQDDPVDKQRQIIRMSVIYSHASEVLAWLGSHILDGKSKPDTADAGVNYLGQSLPSNPPGRNEVRAVQSVVNRPYWKRCWIIQELCVAKKARVLCGKHEADFTIFWENLRYLMGSHSFPYIEPTDQEHLNCLNDFRDQETAKSRGPRMQLIEALLKSRRSLSSHPRDKIFAILQLAHDSSKLVDTPNYIQTDATICWKLAHNMIHLQGHVAIILLARREIAGSGATEPRTPTTPIPARVPNGSTSRRHSNLSSVDFRNEADWGLPSWVPNWSELVDALPEWVIAAVRWQARERDPPATGHIERTLCVRGWLLEEIISVSGVPRLPRHPAPLPNEPFTVGTERRHPVKRKSTVTVKPFHNPVDVFTKLWSTILAPMFDRPGKPNPSIQHECNNSDCDGLYEPGLAIAMVLLKGGETDVIIQEWWAANKSLLVGNRNLERWVDDIVTPNNTRSAGGARTSAHTRIICGLHNEIKYLSEALGLMLRYQMKLAVTHRCTFRLVYSEAHVGDVIWRVEQCVLPIVLRPQSSSPWTVPTSQISEEPGSMGDSDSESTQTTLPPPSVPGPSAPELTQLPEVPQQFTYIGEVYRYNYLKDITWQDQTGWRHKHFDDSQRRDIWIV